ncbi:hypothetical protein C8Q74DRAFT_534728 [Fomes fomentarius]|nr:hypothetical protein C8Q74DRAFT_534728 [Fomes fomentarius]
MLWPCLHSDSPRSQSCIRTRSSAKFSRSPHAPLPSLSPSFHSPCSPRPASSMTAHCGLLELLRSHGPFLTGRRLARRRNSTPSHALQVARPDIAPSRSVPAPHRLAYPLWERWRPPAHARRYTQAEGMSHPPLSIPCSRESEGERVQTSLRSTTVHPHQPPRAQVTLPAAFLSPFSAQSPRLARGPGTEHSASSSDRPPGQGESAELEIEIAQAAHSSRTRVSIPCCRSPFQSCWLPAVVVRTCNNVHTRTHARGKVATRRLFGNTFAANENENENECECEVGRSHGARAKTFPPGGGRAGRATTPQPGSGAFPALSESLSSPHLALNRSATLQHA